MITKTFLRVAVAPGADLALDLLNDDLAAGTPAMQRLLARHALTLLRYPPDQDLLRRGVTLFRVANADQVIRAAVDQAIDQALAGGYCQRETAAGLLNIWRKEVGGLALRSRQIAERENLTKPRRRRSVKEVDVGVNLNEIISAQIAEMELSASESDSVWGAMEVFVKQAGIFSAEQIDFEPRAGQEILSKFNSCLKSPNSATAIANISLAMISEACDDAGAMRGILRAWLQRKSVGGLLVKRSVG